MPKRHDLKKIIILGSGPIVIGQACEFDYSGTQACKALMKEGYEVVLVNSNPATIMTDPEIATRVYIEPLEPRYLEEIIKKEKPQAIVPTLGGQTALNLGLQLDQLGILKKYNVEMLGADAEIIERAEDREKFNDLLISVGAKSTKNVMVRNFDQGLEVAKQFGFPLILRPNYTLGGGGGGIAYSLEEYKQKISLGLHESPTSEVLVEESILGWKEYELEVMRDAAGTFVVICSIENIDPCGVHTGDSITVAPQQTLSDQEYQDMRDEAQKIVEAVGVQTGGANIQFAVCPDTKKRVVIEMNPRVSRSSALASKATGFPIAKIAALLSVGFHLDEITNDITKTTPSCYEPALDYIVTKVPRFAFEKFKGVADELSTQMKSVGEAMSIGRTFKESFSKAFLSLESAQESFPEVLFKEEKILIPNSQRALYLVQAFREGMSVDEIYSKTKISYWFLEQISEIVALENVIKNNKLTNKLLLKAKRYGFSDFHIARLKDCAEIQVLSQREDHKIFPDYMQVDTCAGEFESETPYFYSSYWSARESEYLKSKKPVVALLGSGPNRIGQGVEFDYTCVRSVKQFQKEGYAVVMINSNPETVSTDYDTSDYLFFEPVTSESVAEILRYTQPEGFVAQLGGQTPINISPYLVSQGYKILGSSLEAMDLAEDRKRFSEICKTLDFKLPESAAVVTYDEAQVQAQEIGYPIICRPSYVLGGRRMEVVESDHDLASYFERHGYVISEKNKCQMEHFLESALEVDVDLVRGEGWTLVGGIVEHIERAGVHSGDSMGVLPPQRLKKSTGRKIEALSKQLAETLDIYGFLNLQLAIKNDEVYMIEANPRSSRSVPFIAKATSKPFVDLGVQAILRKPQSNIVGSNYDWKDTEIVSVKGVVFPFKKFSKADSILGPEMKSTGESMGRASNYADALMKSFISSHYDLPASGEIFMSLRDKDKDLLLPLAKQFIFMGYSLCATKGTADFLEDHNIKCKTVKKVHEGRPNCVDRIRSGEICLVINTTSGRQAIEASFDIRRSCIDYSVPCITESDAADSFLLALQNSQKGLVTISPL